jgi:ADP-heptose:LPS heptosyltransferase
MELSALLKAARLHVGPDTGSLHLAWLQGTPTVSWFLNHEHLLAWAPRGSRHRVLVSTLERDRKADNLHGLPAPLIAAAVTEQLMRAPAPLGEELVFEFHPDIPHENTSS